jgi:DNA-binding response OmpR family regulator
LNLRDCSINQSGATLILNASPDAMLRHHRARMLNRAGYYTSSVQTAEEAVHHAASMNCALALICYSFANAERKALSDHLRRVSPGTTIVCVEPGLDRNHRVLAYRIERVLSKLTA